MRFSFSARPADDVAATAAQMREAEHLGFDGAWYPDQTFFRDVFAVLAACAGATRRLLLGAAVVNPYTRHPAVIARGAATVSEVAGGRFRLVLGAGNRRELLTPLGIEQTRPALRMKEAAEAIRHLLTGERVDYVGQTVRLRGARLDFQSRHPIPLFFAGRGPRVLEAAGATADGVIIGSLTTRDGLRFALDQVRRGAAQAGRSLEGFQVISWASWVPARTAREGLESVRRAVAHIVGGAPLEVLRAIEADADLIVRIRARYQEGGAAHAASDVTEALARKLTLFGGPEEVAETIGHLAAAGVGEVSILLPGRGTHGGHVTTQQEQLGLLARFAGETIHRVS